MQDSPSHRDRPFIVALAQTRPALRDIDTNLARMQRILVDHADADVVVFPELALGGYTTVEAGSLAIEHNDARLAQLADTAQQTATAVIFGAALNTPAGLANAAVVIDAHGRWLDSYSKTWLFGDEPEAYVAGDALVIVDLDGVPTGLMICFDIEFPEVARNLATAGAELLVSISANMQPFGPDPPCLRTCPCAREWAPARLRQSDRSRRDVRLRGRQHGCFARRRAARGRR